MSARIQVQFQDMVEDSPDTVAIRSPELRNEPARSYATS